MPRGQARRIRHSKSRLGCQRCKDRKVKCDEARPTCSNCQKYGDVCNFAIIEPAFSRNHGSPSPLSNIQNPAAPPTHAPRCTDTERSISQKEHLLELRLMHHYTSLTSQNAFMDNHDPEIKHLYTHVAPILALDHESLMAAIFSVAAQHLSRLEPSKPEFQDAHRRYFNTAVEYQRAVKQMSSGNAEALCITATLLNIQALTVTDASSGYEPPSVWLELSSSNGRLFTEAWKWISNDNQIICIVKAEPNLRDFYIACRQPYPEIFPPNLGSVFTDLLDFHDPTETCDDESLTVYRFCMGYIAYSLQRIDSQEDSSKIRRLLLAFGAMVPPRYKILIRERRPRALVILSYHFAIVKAVDEVWWLRGVPEREVFGIQSVLPERWQWAMAWPIQKLASFAAATLSSYRPQGDRIMV